MIKLLHLQELLNTQPSAWINGYKASTQRLSTRFNPYQGIEPSFRDWLNGHKYAHTEQKLWEEMMGILPGKEQS